MSPAQRPSGCLSGQSSLLPSADGSGQGQCVRWGGGDPGGSDVEKEAWLREGPWDRSSCDCLGFGPRSPRSHSREQDPTSSPRTWAAGMTPTARCGHEGARLLQRLSLCTWPDLAMSMYFSGGKEKRLEPSEA